MFELQRFLFEKEPSRLDLLEYEYKSKNEFTIGIYRNHSFELVEHTITAYLDYADINAKFIYSDYDDSLTFFNLDLSTDMLILWLDLSKYNYEDIKTFIKERIDFLYKIYPNPILFVSFPINLFLSDDRLINYSLESVKEKLGDQFTDPRLESFSGTKLSAKACMEISKNLGLNYIPALLKPSIKAVIVDLDNTLYDGVLGEDGIEGITLTDSHKRLQQKLKELANKGFFLCIASKNNESDVLSLFNQRIDFPLKINDFTKICASWDDKTDSIYKISRFLNIGTESMLFIDDNIGELFNANEAYPNLHTIWARDDANITLKVLSNYPGLLKLKQHKEDSIRRQDVIANQERNKLRDSMSKEEYIKTLGIELTFHIDNIEQATRVAELANKTNQFIFSYKRYGQEAIKSLMMAKESMVITVSLKDKLSDSGIIGTCVFIHHDDYIELEECFVSCRALGRGIDEIIVLGAIVQAQNFFGDKKLKVNFIKGERNLPAETFVLSFLSNNVSQENYFSYTIPKELFSIKVVKEKF